MKKWRKGMKHSLKVRIIALLMALLMVMFTIPTDAIASILEVSEYQDMEEEDIIELTEEDLVEDEAVDESFIDEGFDEEDEASTIAEVSEDVDEEASDIGISEITTEVSNEEFDILIVDKTEGALSVVYELLVEDKTDETSKEVIEKIAKKENLPIEDVVSETLNIELKDENLDETQPEGVVSVSIAIPEEMNEEDFALYYIGDGDATPTKVKGVIEDGYFTFERSHFCQFCLISTGSGVAIGQDTHKINDTEYQNANVGWYVKHTDSSTFYISTGADLRGLAALTKGKVYYKDESESDFGDVVYGENIPNTGNTGNALSFTGKKIILTNDIAMNEDETFPGIGTISNPFMGEFDGNGHVIRNLTLGDVYEKDAEGYYVRDSQENRIWEKKMILTLDEGRDAASESDDVAYLGMFTHVKNAKIYNLGLESAQAVVSAQNPYNSKSQDIHETDYTHYKLALGLLVAKDSGSSTSLSNIYIYNSKISARDTDHRDVVEAGLVADGNDTKIENCYVMKLSLTATTTHSRFKSNLYSLAALTNYSLVKNTYYLETSYNGDNETGTLTKEPAYKGHGDNVSKKSELEFLSKEIDGVAELINSRAAEADKIADGKIFIVKDNGTHPVFVQQKTATTAKITIQTLHNERLSNAAGYFQYKQNINMDYSKNYNSRTITIATGYASFAGNGYLQLNAIRKDTGYTFDGWYTGVESKDENGKTVITLDKDHPLSTNPEFILKDDGMTDMSVYANFNGSPYTLSALVVDYDCPYEPNSTESEKETAINISRNDINQGATKRASISAKADPYSEWLEYVYEEDGVNIKKDSKGEDVKKTVSKGNIKGGIVRGPIDDTDNGKFEIVEYNGNPLTDGATTPYVITWDVRKSGEVTLNCTPNDGFTFVAWYESINTLPYITDDDVFLSDSKKDDCELKVSKILSNHVIKCLVTKSVNINTYFTKDAVGRGNDGYNNSLSEPVVEDESYLKSTYGEICIAEGSPVGKGAGYTLSAKATKGHKFVGWFNTPNPTYDTETEDYEKNGDGKYTELLSKEPNYTLSLSSKASDDDLTYYAVFEDQAIIEVEKVGNILTLHDQGLTARRIVYQYSDPENGYPVPDWESFVYNGQGLLPDGKTYKDSYEENKDAYKWNGELGYHQFTLDTEKGTGIDGKQIIFKYPGHYTLCIFPSDGSVMFTRDIVVSGDDTESYDKPTITMLGSSATARIEDAGHIIKNVYYQLTKKYEDNTLPGTIPAELEYVSWYRFAKNGQASDVAAYNGKDGYITVGANCGGQEVSLTQIGWYTFFIKYDDGENEICYVKVNSEMINGSMFTPPSTLEEGSANGKVTVIACYSEGEDATAIIKIVSENVVNGQSYAVKLTANTDNDIPAEKRVRTGVMVGNANNKTYLCKVTGLQADTNYIIEAVNAAGNSIDSEARYEGFTTSRETVEAAKVESGYYGRYDSGYYANTLNGTSFRINSNGTVDAHGRFDAAGENPSHALWTTYSNNGWGYYKDNSNIDVIPTARIVKGFSETEYILFTYVLHNNTAGSVTNFRIGFSADTMINTNDYAPVSKEPFGFRICNSNDPSDESAINFVLIANSEVDTDSVGRYTDTCTTKWFGSYSARNSNLYTEIPDGSTYGGDSGAAFSYQGINFAPGEVKTISFILGVAPTSALSLADTNVPTPNVGKEGSKARVSSNSQGDVEYRINAVYYQYASDDMNLTVPYTYESFKAVEGNSAARSSEGKKITTGENAYSLSEFKARGITYKQFNGLSGMKTLFEETQNYTYAEARTSKEIYNDIKNKKSSFVENDTNEHGEKITVNNMTTFDEPGWYTFLIDFYKVYANIDSGDEANSEYYADRYLKEVDILVTADDLNGVPFLNKEGSMVQIFNNSSNLYSVTYQLTDLDATGDECPYLYSDWNHFYHMGQGLYASEDANHTITWLNRDDKRVYQRVNGTNGYKILTQNLEEDGPQGARQLVFTTAGWYTFRLNYKTYDGEAKSVIRYVKITEDDVNNGGPRLVKQGNTIILNENNSKVTKVVYQLTTANDIYMNKSGDEDEDDSPEDVLDIIEWDSIDEYKGLDNDQARVNFKKAYDGVTNRDEFLFLYEYGTGFYYTTVMDNLYKKSSTNSDWAVFTRIGQAVLEDYRAQKTTEYMIKANYSTGYRTVKPIGGNDRTGYVYDGASVTVQNPGWYTFLVTYGDGVVAAEYIQITEDDIGNAPNVLVDDETGEISLDIGDYQVLGAYLSYATDTNLDKETYPADVRGLSYYLDNTNNYSWYNFCKYGETHYPEVNGDDGYLTMMTTLSGDYVTSARYMANKAGWYNVYISFVVGDDVENKKVAVKHVKLANDVAGPTVTQVTSDKVITDKNGTQHYDNRMMLRYTDKVTDEDYPIAKYAVGYFAYKEGTYNTETKVPKNISTWYRMALATEDVRSVTQKVNTSGKKAIEVLATEDGNGRYFDIPVDREGYYVVMVIDAYYGNRIYITEVKEVPILDDKVVGAPKLYVSEKTITGVKNGVSGKEVAYLKDVTDLTSETINNEMAKQGNVLKGKVSGERIIRVVDYGGRVYDLKAILQGNATDDSGLISLIKKAHKLIETYQAVSETEYFDDKIDNHVPGWWVIEDYETALEELINNTDDDVFKLISYDLKTDKITIADNEAYANLTQDALEERVLQLKEKIANFEAYSIIIESDIIKVVDGEEGKKNIEVTVGDLISKGHSVEYFLYSAADLYDVSDIAGYRQIKETVWDSWAGIASEKYNQYMNPKENFVLKDVPEGVYTFQIKIDGVVYYVNPVVVTTEGKGTTEVIKDYLGIFDEDGNITAGLINEANELLTEIHKESSHTAPYVSDALYDLLVAEIEKATIFCENAPITEDMPKKINVGTKLRPKYYILSDENIIKEAADLHNLMRKVRESKSEGVKEHKAVIDGTTVVFNGSAINVSSTEGKVVLTSYENSNNAKITKLYVARGHHTTWGSFAAQSYIDCTFGNPQTVGGNTVRNSTFYVSANGEYTMFIKYDDNVYGFAYFIMKNYEYRYTVTYNDATGKIDITIPAGEKITELQIADGEYTKFTSKFETIDNVKTQTGTAKYFDDIWYTYKDGANGEKIRDKFVVADKINTNGYTKESVTLSTPRRSLNEHTVYVKVYNSETKSYDEVFIPIAPTSTPIIVVNYVKDDEGFATGVDGKRMVETIKAVTTIGDVAWVAYAKGDYVTDNSGWNGMLGSPSGVRYISQNRDVIIPRWSSIGDKYTFFFRGANDKKDYIILVGGDTYDKEEDLANEKEDAYTENGTNNKDAGPVDDTYKLLGDASFKKITLKKQFKASEDGGTAARYYKVRAYIVGDEDSALETDFIEIPAEGDELEISLPLGFVTTDGNEVTYEILTYAEDSEEAEAIQTISDTFRVDQSQDIYRLYSTDVNNIKITKVNAGNDGNPITKYSIEASAGGETVTVPKTNLPAESDHLITIGVPAIENLENGISSGNFIINLYSETGDAPIDTIEGTFPIKVNGEYQVELNSRSLTNNNIELKVKEKITPLYGGIEAKKYKIRYTVKADVDDVTTAISGLGDIRVVSNDATSVVIEETGTISEDMTITFSNDFAINSINVTLLTADDQVIEPAFNVGELLNPNNDSFKATASRLMGDDDTSVRFELNSKVRSNGERAAQLQITTNSVSLARDAHSFTNVMTPYNTQYPDNTAEKLYAWIYSDTGKLIQRIIIDVKISEEYEISLADSSGFVVSNTKPARNGGQTATKYDYKISLTSGATEPYASGTVNELNPAQFVNPVVNEDIDPGTSLTLEIKVYFDDNSSAVITKAFDWYKNDLLKLDVTDSTYTLSKEVTKDTNGRAANYYALVITDSEGTIKVSDKLTGYASDITTVVNGLIADMASGEITVEVWSYDGGDSESGIDKVNAVHLLGITTTTFTKS